MQSGSGGLDEADGKRIVRPMRIFGGLLCIISLVLLIAIWRLSMPVDLAGPAIAAKMTFLILDAFLFLSGVVIFSAGAIVAELRRARQA